MFGRPRCREWTPLATQQLRLRSLIQIVGYNIRPPETSSQQCSFYVTLHHTTMSAPFYTSERIASPHPKWKEIDSEITQRMSSANVVIRIWCHEMPQNSQNNQDTIIQTWGIYFSGLRYIGANLSLNFTSDCFKSNTIVLQMHGGYFCSYKSLKLDVIPHENEIEHGSLSSDSSSRASNKITVQRPLKDSRSASPNVPTKELSKSHSPDTGYKQTVVKTSSLNINQRKKGIFEHSPTVETTVNSSPSSEMGSKVDLSETAENYDLRSENDWVPKYRYLAINFLKSEIRPSYNVSKLQKLHLLQYSIKKKQEAVQEIKERIYKKSALSNEELVGDAYEIKPKFKSRSPRNLFSDEMDERPVRTEPSENGRVKERPNGPRLTLKLNDLLSIKSKPSPYQRAEHIRLTKQIEILRFKRLILSDERDAKLANIRRLKEAYSKLCEENQDIGSELMQNYHALSKSQESVRNVVASASAAREFAARAQQWLDGRRARLLRELHDIFYVEQVTDDTWTILSTPLPISSDCGPCLPPHAAAAGLCAQALTLASAVLDLPLRYKMTLLGSASKVLDVTDLPDPNIPLYPRNGDVTLFRYGLFLLNKSLAQLLAARGLPCGDVRPTLNNLRTLLTATPKECDRSRFDCSRTQSLRSLVASDRGKHCRQFNRFKDAVEGQPPHSLLSLRHRTSRSVGSCRDENDLPEFDQSTTSMMGSEPNIYDKKLSTASIELKTHNSDSEISRITPDKVTFTLGDDIVDTRKLVKISTNNEKECRSCIDENVKSLCEEITDFCTQNDNTDIQGIDIAKHIEGMSVVDNSCDCSVNDDICETSCPSMMKDVIVIQSAEARFDVDDMTLK